jgi:UDPglucose 6-dehydrogenase
MKISIVGTGYVGLVTGVGLASIGHEVICVDINADKVRKINSGQSPIHEKDLDALLAKVLKKKLLSATADLAGAVAQTDMTFIAVGTPSLKNDDIDLSYIKKVSEQIGKALVSKKTYHTVVVKSTVAPETTLAVVLPMVEKYSKKKGGSGFGLCMNPEFLREGNAVEDFINPDRIVIGQLDKQSGDALETVYKKFNTEIVRTSPSNAELIKYTNNALLATLISFSNEIASIAEKVPGSNVFDILKGVFSDKRMSPVIDGRKIHPQVLNYLRPGCGFGGSCFPKDVRALAAFSKKRKHPPLMLKSVLDINKKQPLRMIELTQEKLGNLKNKKIAILGLAFKPETDDIRESPAIAIIKELISKKANVFAYDPIVTPANVQPPLKNLHFTYAKSLEEVLKGKDACLLVTNWKEFKKITPQLLKKNMARPILIDGRGFFDSKDFTSIEYSGIGLGK